MGHFQSLFSVVNIAIVIVHFCKGKVANCHCQALKEALPLLAYPLIYNIFFTIMLANRVYHAIATMKDEDPIYPFLLAHAIAKSLQVVLAALAVLLHPNICRKLKKPGNPKSTSVVTEFNVSAEFPQNDPLQSLVQQTPLQEIPLCSITYYVKRYAA